MSRLTLTGSGQNTRLKISYRDASNFKFGGDVILGGELSQHQLDQMVAAMDDRIFFLPEQVKLPSFVPEDYDEELDHPWHTISEASLTVMEPNSELSVAELTKNWPESPSGWDRD